MTALAQYQRLEAQGIWRPAPEAQLRDVIVSFGDATLILRDPLSERPLAHWSLAAVTRLNPGERPAIFAPGGVERDEVVEIDDALMVDAIERVHAAIDANRPHPGRVRTGMVVLVTAALVAGAAAWLPGAVERHAARIAPPAQRAAVGRMILADVMLATGPACARPNGTAILGRLSDRLLGGRGRIVVLPATLRGARALPGDLIIVGDDLIAGEATGEVAAGHILAADETARARDPMLPAVRHAGVRAAFALLTRGEMPVGALAGYGRQLLAAPPDQPGDDPLLARMQAAGVPSEPYARSLDPTGETVLALIEADPFRTGGPAKPPVTAAEWAQLQQICAE